MRKEDAVAALRADLKAGRLRPSYLFYGEEEYLKRHYVREIVKLFESKFGPPEVVMFGEGFGKDAFADAVETMADEDGYAFMGDLGNLLVKKQPDFDPRNFGFSKLTQLVRYLPRFEVDVRQTSLPHVKHIYVRDKARK